MIKATVTAGNPACNHKWVKRDKATISILSRACTECGQVEIHSECPDIDDKIAKKIMKVE